MSKENDTTKKSQSKREFHNARVKELLNTPIYDDRIMEDILTAIEQNIYIEMKRQKISTRQLGDLANVNYSHLSKIFNGKTHIGLSAFIRISCALCHNPKDFLPCGEKTKGECFDEIIREMDDHGSDFLLKFCSNYAKEYARIRHLSVKLW